MALGKDAEKERERRARATDRVRRYRARLAAAKAGVPVVEVQPVSLEEKAERSRVRAVNRVRNYRARLAAAKKAAVEVQLAAASGLTVLRKDIEAEALRQTVLLQRVYESEGFDPDAPAVERALSASRALILRLMGNPLLRMAELAAMPTEGLARLLGAKDLLEVRRLQHAADVELCDRLFGRPAVAGGSSVPAVSVSLNVTPEMASQIGLRGRVLGGGVSDG